jgi:hypothetical protein
MNDGVWEHGMIVAKVTLGGMISDPAREASPKKIKNNSLNFEELKNVYNLTGSIPSRSFSYRISSFFLK